MLNNVMFFMLNTLIEYDKPGAWAPSMACFGNTRVRGRRATSFSVRSICYRRPWSTISILVECEMTEN